jgi:hypothetical protein
MNKSIGGFVVCLLGLVACNVEHYDDCDEQDPFELEDGFGGSHSRAGSTSTGGSEATTGGTEAASGTGATTSEGGTAPTTEPQPCDSEDDCQPGFNCAFDAQECQPADEETCGELTTEAACTHRSDCTPIYAGINCSCGPDCECRGGEPGCVCESFGFFGCE